VHRIANALDVIDFETTARAAFHAAETVAAKRLQSQRLPTWRTDDDATVSCEAR
jgi:hypothetical protein